MAFPKKQKSGDRQKKNGDSQKKCYGGNGTFIIYAIASDTEGNTVTLGSKTINCDNANAVKPFGAIDTPAQGGAASGNSFINWGWVLTPPPNRIPTDGSTINVYVDGVNLGHPTYNIYRFDIATLFPNYANSNGAAGYFYLDTTAYENGVHTIQWTATDDAGNTDGIGSRYFTIRNTNTGSSVGNNSTSTSQSWKDAGSEIPVDYFEPVKITKGNYMNIEPERIYPDKRGVIKVEIKELERIEIHLGNSNYTGYLLVGSQLRPLPIGSTLNAGKGVFYWQLGSGFIGEYRFVFVEKCPKGESKRKDILIKVIPKFTVKSIK